MVLIAGGYWTLLMALWRRGPSGMGIVHSGQGSQYGSDDLQRF